MLRSKQKICIYTFIVLTFLYLFVSVQISNTEVSVEGWGYNTTRDTTQYLLRHNLSAHILPERFCDRDSFLMVMVCSGPTNSLARLAIRDTWGRQKTIHGVNVSLFFLLGEPANATIQYDVMLESIKYGDIIEDRFIDSYNNLTLKSLFMLKLLINHCSNSTKYLLKIDDDMYVNLDLIVQNLKERNTTTDLLMGKLICGARPIKDSTSKWYSPRYMYNGYVYPNYLSGTGYMMSLDVAHRLYNVSLETPLFHLEDVYLTGICAKNARIRPKNNSLFTYQRLNFDLCHLMKLFTAHRFTPNDIRRTFYGLKDGNLTRDCNALKNRFNVNRWIVNNILKVNRSYPKSKCE